MTKPKTSPTNGERFDRLRQFLANSEGNDFEIAAVHEISEALWQLLTPEQEDEFFAQIAVLEANAVKWASHEVGGNIATNAARIAFSLHHNLDLTPARLEEVIAAATALDSIEAQPGFIWEDQPADWECVCARLADAIGSGRPRSWQPEIRRLLARKRRATRRAT